MASRFILNTDRKPIQVPEANITPKSFGGALVDVNNGQMIAQPDNDFMTDANGNERNVGLNEVVNGTQRGDPGFLMGRMPFFDTRVYRSLTIFKDTYGRTGGYRENEDAFNQIFYPHFHYGSYVQDLHETTTAIDNLIAEAKANKADLKSEEDSSILTSQIELLQKKKKSIERFNAEKYDNYLAPRSFIHPYALVRLAGASGNHIHKGLLLTYDKYDHRKFYEIDGGDVYSANYSRTPTTTKLIKWGNESSRGKTPYSFQDFIFCKWWNKIENNRLITLRRYAAPVTDNIEFSDFLVQEVESGDGKNEDWGIYDATDINSGKQKKYRGRNSDSPWTPLATAVTYFGEETGNKLSDILAFSAHYNWEEKKAEENPIDITSAQNDMGDNGAGGLIDSGLSGVTSGLGMVGKIFGFLGEVNGGRTINLEAAPSNLPPDPYSQGPYENRILGPINVIMNTYRRKRGLEFKQDGLKITFSYVARPIAGINNKAILLDLMSNILLMTYASGSWFGGMWRYKTESPAVYPWQFGDAMNSLYQGKILGRDSFGSKMTKHIFVDGTNYLSTFLPDAAEFISGLFKSALSFLKNAIGLGGENEPKTEAREQYEKALSTGTGRAIQKVVAARALRGATVPYIKNQRALLTGEPVGDWHLTVGNPLNPIVMIGNLIVKDVRFKWSDELGPDDFPIGFDAEITLDHGLGRDRDAIESMFNRGFGRIYTLSSAFRSSADGETKVDDATGGVNTQRGRIVYNEPRINYFGGGTRFIAKIQQSSLKNSGRIYTGNARNINSLSLNFDVNGMGQHTMSEYYVNPWQMGMSL